MFAVGIACRRSTSWMGCLEHGGDEGKRRFVRPCDGSQTTIRRHGIVQLRLRGSGSSGKVFGRIIAVTKNVEKRFDVVFFFLILDLRVDFCDFGISEKFFVIALGRRSYGFYDFIF